MTNFVKAELDRKTKTGKLIRIAVVSTISLVGIILAVTNLIGGAVVYALAYLAAGTLGVLYAIISINATFVQNIIMDGDKLFLNTWENGFFPFDINYKPRFLADFVPAKSVSYEINLADVSEIAVGSKGFLLKMTDSDAVSEKMNQILATDAGLDKFLKRYDIFYVKLTDGRTYMMEVNNFDTDSLYAIADYAERTVQGLEFKTNVRLLRRRKDSKELRPRI